MPRQRIAKHAHVEPQADARDLHVLHRTEHFGVWLTSRQACAYVPCASIGAWYQWRRRHGIVPRKNGSVARADIDRALKGQRRIHAASLANLNQRKAS